MAQHPPGFGSHSNDPRQGIRNKALHLGFDAVGFCKADFTTEARDRLTEFLQSGYHGDMGWLASNAESRANPKALWPDANSAVVVGFSYAPGDDPLSAIHKPKQGSISVYARNRDYHDVMKGKLKHLAQFLVSQFDCEVKIFVDTAPIMEKPLAHVAGIGWQGKHTNLVSRRHGSWLFLGEILTTLPIQADEPGVDRCGSCFKCLAACPTNAFPSPYRLDATKCISYLTIEHKGSIPVNFRKAIGNRIYGCDDCLAVCPWNKFAEPTIHPALIARQDLTAPPLAALSELTDSGFRSLFSGSPIKRIGRNRFIRNVLIAIGNSNDPALLPHARRLTGDPDPVVAEAAKWAVDQLVHLSSCNSKARA